MNMNHKPGSTFRSVLIVMLFFIAGFAFILNNTALHAESNEDPSKIVQEIPELDIIIINNNIYKENENLKLEIKELKKNE